MSQLGRVLRGGSGGVRADREGRNIQRVDCLRVEI